MITSSNLQIALKKSENLVVLERSEDPVTRIYHHEVKKYGTGFFFQYEVERGGGDSAAGYHVS